MPSEVNALRPNTTLRLKPPFGRFVVFVVRQVVVLRFLTGMGHQPMTLSQPSFSAA
jgi:hypothetical protein